ncbi:phage terminase large subunit family protein [Rhodanobacter thiooxydans]|uniref:phage terminase large subunit family protein n=1 Tax=Rhodanobacter thiooxydans TaxID=416169 RepID=UPI000260DA36|nr:phage terminase large subunit family protein [Rhodanobacter thiooxydans]EIL99135.1 phage terminase GpA [Rhodanobacter thiooxydans LCS2]
MLDLDTIDVDLASGTDAVLDSWRRGWTIPEPITLSAWADKYRKLPKEGSSEAGDWYTSRMPFLREIMDCLHRESTVREITIKKSTQVGGTEVGINWLGYIIEHAPASVMYVLPTIDTARKFSEQRLTPAINLMPVLQERIPPARSRDSGNTTLMKKFPGGVLVLSGANSSASLASMPIMYLILDELSKYPTDLDDQGGAEQQALRRTSSYVRRKVLRISSATIKDACAISAAYDAGDQSRYYVPCPHCARKQVLMIDQVTDDGQYLCVACGRLIDEHHKTRMLEAGEWIALFPERSASHRSFHIWSAMAAIGLGYTWREIADMRAEARKDSAKEVVFVNTILGEAYEGASQKVEANDLQLRAGKWVRRTIPRGGFIVTAGVDVQVNRFAVQIVAWGRNEQAWIVDYVELPADPTRKEDWDILWDFLAQPVANAAGITLHISAAAVDSGNWTQEVYNAVRPRQSQGVMAIKGSKDATKPIIGRASKQEVDTKGRTQRKGVNLWIIGVNSAKSTLMQRLLGDTDRDEESRLIHFPKDLPDDYYAMLTAERFDLAAKRWLKKKGARNEALDTLVYAYAAALSPSIRIHVKREADWAAMEAKLEPANDDLFTTRAPLAIAAQPRPEATSTTEQTAVQTSAAVVARGTPPAGANPFASPDWLSRRD